MSAARSVRHAPLELRGRRVLLRSLTEDDFPGVARGPNPARGTGRRGGSRDPGAPRALGGPPRFAARCGIRERKATWVPATGSGSSWASGSPAR